MVVFGDCTSGLAETLIERGARLVHVYDSDLSRVTEAAARGSLPNVAYAPLGQSGVVARDGTFDLGVVENLAASDDPAGLLARLRRALAARGVAFVSTPNLEVEPVLLSDPEHAEKGPSYYELFELVSAQFSEVRMVGQTPFVGYALAEFGADAGNQFSIDTGFVPGGAEEPEWYLAAAGHFPLQLDAFSVIQLPAEEVLNAAGPPKGGPPSLGVSREHEFAQLKAELEKRDAWASELEARSSAADERADQAESRVEALEAELDSLKAEVARMRSQAQQERERQAAATQAQQERERQASAAQASSREREQEREKRTRAEQSTFAAQKTELEAALTRKEELEKRARAEQSTFAAQKSELEAALARQAELETALGRQGELEAALKRAQSQLERAEAATKQREADAAKHRAQDAERKKEAEAARQRDLEAADAEMQQLRDTNAELQGDIDHFEEQLRERGRTIDQLRRDMQKTERLCQELLAELEESRDKPNGAVHVSAAPERGTAEPARAESAPQLPVENPRLAELERRIGELARVDALRVADLTAAQWSVQELEAKLHETESAARNEAEHLRHELQAKSALLEQLRPSDVEV